MKKPEISKGRKGEIKITYLDPSEDEPNRRRAVRGMLEDETEHGIWLRRDDGNVFISWSDIKNMRPAK